jgi:hypothetical protein
MSSNPERRYTDHDQLFKELLRTFFKEFLEVFFPSVFEAVDQKHFKFLQQESFVDINKGEKKIVDLLVETKLKDEDSVIVVHVETQAQPEEDFNERMFIYFSRLYQNFRCRILPIAVFSHDAAVKEPLEFRIGFPFFSVLDFRFLTLHLRHRDWREYIRSDNPAAAALMSKMNYTQEEKVRVKLEFLKMLVRMNLNPGQKEYITQFFETYLPLTPEEDSELQERINNEFSEEEVGIMITLMTSWERKGRKEGKEEGKGEGKSEMLLMIAKKRFTFLTPEIEEKIAGLSLGQLDEVALALMEMDTLSELETLLDTVQ